jgi:adenylyl-sulfate kinase
VTDRPQSIQKTAGSAELPGHIPTKFALPDNPVCIWITGLSGAGKSTVAAALCGELAAATTAHYVLDGDSLREGLNKDLGFSREDRCESVRRAGEIARLMVEAGLIVIVAMISPFREDRDLVRSRFQKDRFLEVFLDTPLDVCETRDPKGLYRRARRGEIPDFTGIGSAYEPPESPDLHIRHDGRSADTVALEIIAALKSKAPAIR